MALDNLMNTLGAQAPQTAWGSLGMSIPKAPVSDPMANVAQQNASLPQMNGAIAPSMEGEELATPDDYAAYAEELDNIDKKVNQIESQFSISDNALTDFKEDLIKSTLYEMEALGVDLTDSNSVSEFLTELDQRSPDLYDYVSYVFWLIEDQDQLETLTNEVQQEGAPAQEAGVEDFETEEIETPDMSASQASTPSMNKEWLVDPLSNIGLNEQES